MVDTPNSERNPLDEITAATDASRSRLDEQIEENTSGRRRTSSSPEEGEHNSSGGTGEAQSGNGGGSEPPSNTPPANENQQDNSQYGGIPGVSSAYGINPDELKVKQAAKKDKKSSGWPKAPERKDPKVKAPSGKTISEMIWNELLSFYEWVIDKSVDLVLDFTTFVLYPSAPGSSDKKEEAPKDIFAKGKTQHEKWKQEQLQNKELVLAMHNEIFDNLRRQKIGAPLVWTHIGEKPAFFDNLYAIYAEAERNPQSEAAKTIKQLKKFPELVNKMLENSSKIGTVAYNYAILQEYMKPSKEKEQEQHINEVAKGQYETIMTNVNKIRAAYQDNPEEMNNVIQRYVVGVNDALRDLHGSIMPFYESGKTMKKRDKEQTVSKAEVVENAINHFEISVPGENGTDRVSKKLSEIDPPESGVIRIPDVLRREGTPENVQQEQLQRGREDFGNLVQAHLQTARRA